MKARKVAPAAAARWRAQLDLFGHVQITRQDVYAWLLAVVDLDPTSFRAFDYVRTYGVLQKITRAKLDGTFEELVAPAKSSARFRELADRRAVEHTKNELGLGEPTPTKHEPLRYVNLRAPRRAAEVIREERERLSREKNARQAVKATMLRRLPTAMPLLSQMLEDIGNPPAEALAGAFDVSISTARRWLRDDAAPRAVSLSLFWLTKWGVSTIDAQAQCDAQRAALLASSLRGEVEELRATLDKVSRIADYGSANDPVPIAPAGIAAPVYQIPAELRADGQVPIVLTWMMEVPGGKPRRSQRAPVKRDTEGDVPIVFNSMRRPRCAGSGR